MNLYNRLPTHLYNRLPTHLYNRLPTRKLSCKHLCFGTLSDYLVSIIVMHILIVRLTEYAFYLS